MQAIASSSSPEEAARIGRRTERSQPQLLRPDWPQAKLHAMHRALRAKFQAHAGPRRMLLETATAAATGTGSATPMQVSPKPYVAVSLLSLEVGAFE